MSCPISSFLSSMIQIASKIFVLCLMILSSVGLSAMDVYIFAGQSNGYRLSSLRPGDLPLPDGRKIYYYSMGCTSEPESSSFQVITSISPKSMGMALAFGLLDNSGEDIALIQYCRCGSGVWDQRSEERKGWFPGVNPQAGDVFDGGLFGKFEQYVMHARAELEDTYHQTWDLKGLFWHQGENDSNDDHYLRYENNLTNLFWRFRELLGNDLPIVMGEIRELTEGDREVNKILAQVAGKDDKAALARASDLAFEPDREGVPNVHFAFEGCQDLGRRMVAAFKHLSGGKYATWGAYSGSSDSAQYSSLDQINTTNVRQLEVAWTYETGDSGKYFFAPLVVDRVAYVLAQDQSVVALDAASGKELWRHVPEHAGKAMTTRGINFWQSKDGSEKRLFYANDHKLFAIDATHGKLIRSFGGKGSINLKEGLGRDPEKLSLVQSHSPGRVFEDLLILGSATNQGYGSAPGDVRAFDVRSGKLVWTFHTIPHPGEFGYETWPADAWKTVGGANVWTEFTVDEDRGIVYLPVASAKYNFYGADRGGTNLFSNCLVALNARTGKYLWHFQFVHHDIWDYDPATAPKLLTIEQDGDMVDVVAQATKQGFLFVFDRETGEPIWPVEERPVPQGTEMPHETLWPTQPFPTLPQPFARQRFALEDLNPFLNDEDREHAVQMMQQARNEGLFTPPGQRDTIQMPGNNGGSNWGGATVNPDTGWMFVVSKDLPAILKLEEDTSQLVPPPDDPALRGQYLYDVHCHRCHTVAVQENPLAVSSLVGVMDKLSPEQILKVIRQGQGPMPGFPDLTADDTRLLLDFLRNPKPIQRQATDLTGQLKNQARFVSGFGLVRATLGLPLIGPPWTTLTAYDLNAGRLVWQIPWGEVPALVEKHVRFTGSVMQKVGPVATAGGLIFLGSRDGMVRAVDQQDGRILWEKDVGVALEGIPAVYTIAGKQYLLFCAAAQKGLTTDTEGPIRGKYVAFALPD